MGDSGLPLELLSLAQSRQADTLAVAAGIDLSTLMEQAGRAVAQAIQARWSPRPVVVLCGPGNNGGDGLVASHHLVQAGWPVRVGLSLAPGRLPPALQAFARRLSVPLEPLGTAVLEGAQLVVDALFGAGLNRPLDGRTVQLLHAVRACALPVVAVDVPSGLDGDTGQAQGAIPAELTVTFFRRKPAHLLASSRALCGEICLADIGIPGQVLDALGVDTFANGPALWTDRRQLEVPVEGHTGIPLLTWQGAPNPARVPNLLAWARATARERGTLVVVEGPTPVLADPAGRAVIHPAALAAGDRARCVAKLHNCGTAAGSTVQDPLLRLSAALWSYRNR